VTRRITVGDSRRAFHVKRDHNREHPETPKETGGARGSKWIERARAGRGVDRSRGGNLVAGHDLQNRARGSRAWLFFRRRRVSCGLAEGTGSVPTRFWPSTPVDERTGLSEAFSRLFKGKELCRYID